MKHESINLPDPDIRPVPSDIQSTITEATDVLLQEKPKFHLETNNQTKYMYVVKKIIFSLWFLTF